MEDDSEDKKVFNDPVHGTITLHPFLVDIINTPQFQRLRNIKQLGGVYYVYPGASHNRFEHSIGTAHLAGKLVRHLRDNQKDLGIDDKDVLCVEIAGLCHDLGHGPFSHLYDDMFIKKLKDEAKKDKGPKKDEDKSSHDDEVDKTETPHEAEISPKKGDNGEKEYPAHEKVSCNMLDHLLKGIEAKKKKWNLDKNDITFIKEMINGPEKDQPFEGRKKEKWFLYEIISNKINGVDVDKWDYFARDCHHLGISNGFDHNRFIQFLRVIKVEKHPEDGYEDDGLHICGHEKECFNLYGMFHTRCALHRRAYQHKVGNAVEHMISDALVLADKHILIRGSLVNDSSILELDWTKAKDVGDGCKQLPGLTDVSNCCGGFLKSGNEVYYLRTLSQCVKDPVAFTKLDDSIFQQILNSDNKELKEARDILKRITNRDLYKVIADEKEFYTGNDLEQQIVSGSETIKKDDLVVSLVKLNYGSEDQNPVDKYRFYSKNDKNTAKKITRDELSNMLPAEFEERRIQVFCKDNKKVDEAKRCYQEWKLKTVG